jgi:predicted double-glycine peptidase
VGSSRPGPPTLAYCFLMLLVEKYLASARRRAHPALRVLNVRPISSMLICLVGLAVANPNAFAGEGGRHPVRSLLEIRQEGVIVQKWETSCAAAALATVLTFSQNDPVSEKLVAQGMLRSTDPIKVKVRGGFSLLDMKRFVETRGFKGAGYKGLSMEDFLTLQNPIVPIDFHGNPHFVVVRGLNTAGEVHLADPAFGNHAMSVETFQSVWKEGIGFVVTQ